jgi:RNA polymerase sigma factor (TIGR02999 family)
MAEAVDIGSIQEFMGELRSMARQLLAGERNAHSVRPTALVNSALRRSRTAEQDWSDLTWQNRNHFFACMYREMRRTLTDHARRRSATKRPQIEYVAPEDFDLNRLPTVADAKPEIVLAMYDALDWLEQSDPPLHEIVCHHYFTGMKVAEIAGLTELSEKTVDRRLARGRLLLHQKILELVND